MGFFCVKETALNIVRKEEYKKTNCFYGLQSGPILIERPSKIVIRPEERIKLKKYRRSVVAIDKKGRLLLIITSEAYLYDLAVFLSKEELQGGLDCLEALNMSGDDQAGLYVKHRKSHFIFGDIDIPISSAIAIFD